VEHGAVPRRVELLHDVAHGAGCGDRGGHAPS
jgi:hypothetical protein